MVSICEFCMPTDRTGIITQVSEKLLTLTTFDHYIPVWMIDVGSHYKTPLAHLKIFYRLLVV